MEPEAPNYFDPRVASPGEIQFDFSPADTTADTYRLEFFDRYTEWDMARISAHEEATTPRTIIDLSVDDTSSYHETDTLTTRGLHRILENVTNTDGFVLE